MVNRQLLAPRPLRVPNRAVGGPPDKAWVGRSFSAAAPDYDAVAGLQREIGERLLARLPGSVGEPGLILDAGTGTGHFAEMLARRFPEALVIALDLAEGMLRRARDRLPGREAALCAGDVEALPLAKGSADIIFSNLAMQWCADPRRLFREFRRVLRPGGEVFFSSFGPATLSELRRAFAVVDGFSHVNDFVPLAELAEGVKDAGFTVSFLTAEIRSVEYPDVLGLMRALKDLGAHNVTAGRPRHLTGKVRFARVVEAYGARTESGIRASFEAIYGQARRESVR